MNVTDEGRRWFGARFAVLLAACGVALVLSARPVAAGVNVFVGATVGIPLPVYPVYAAPAYYPPPPAAYYAPPPVYVDYGPRWIGKHHKPHWKKFYRNCHRCGGYCR